MRIRHQMKRYLITDPAYYSDLSSFQHYLKKSFYPTTPDLASFRDKVHPDIAEYAKTFLALGREAQIPRLLINRSVPLAVSLGFDGVHLTSTQFDEIAPAKAEGLYVFISTHSLEEAKRAEEYGADAITLSPVFASPGKGVPKGIAWLEEIASQLKEVSVYALGGIVSDHEADRLKVCSVEGFASIRYFI